MSTATREIPIIFSPEMVRAILEGRKTQTRRIVKPQPPKYCDTPVFDRTGLGWFYHGLDESGDANEVWPDDDKGFRCPYGQEGDVLWVREAWGWRGQGSQYGKGRPQHWHDVLYRADGTQRRIFFEDGDEALEAAPPQNIVLPKNYSELPSDEQVWAYDRALDAWWQRQKKKPSIHMPKWACRLKLRRTFTRVERVQDISEMDALADGGWAYSNCPRHKDPIGSFRDLWDRLHGPGAWERNDWVWVIGFEPQG